MAGAASIPWEAPMAMMPAMMSSVPAAGRGSAFSQAPASAKAWPRLPPGQVPLLPTKPTSRIPSPATKLPAISTGPAPCIRSERRAATIVMASTVRA